MDAGLASIVVASITAMGGLLVTIIQKLRKENKNDHDTVMEFLVHVSETIRGVDNKLDEHIQWHLEKTED